MASKEDYDRLVAAGSIPKGMPFDVWARRVDGRPSGIEGGSDPWTMGRVREIKGDASDLLGKASKLPVVGPAATVGKAAVDHSGVLRDQVTVPLLMQAHASNPTMEMDPEKVDRFRGKTPQTPPPVDKEKPEAQPEDLPPQASRVDIIGPLGAKHGGGGGGGGPIAAGQATEQVLHGTEVPKEAKDHQAKAYEIGVKGTRDAVEMARDRAKETIAVIQGQEDALAEHGRQQAALAAEKSRRVEEFNSRVRARLDAANSDDAITRRTIGVVLSGIGVAMGAYAASMRGGPNHAMELYRSNIDQEAKRLEQESKNEANLYARMYQEFGDKDQALAMTKASIIERSLLELRKIEVSSKEDATKNMAVSASRDLELSQSAQLAAVAEKEAGKRQTTYTATDFAGSGYLGHGLPGSMGARPQGAPAAPTAPLPQAAPGVAPPRASVAAPTGKAPMPHAAPGVAAPAAPAGAPSAPAGKVPDRAARLAARRQEILEIMKTIPNEDKVAAKKAQAEWGGKDHVKDRDAYQGALAFERVFPKTGTRSVLDSKTVVAIDALNARAGAAEKGSASSVFYRQAANSLYKSLTTQQQAEYDTWNVMRAEFIRAHAGANLSANEESMYLSVIGKYDTQAMYRFYIEHLKPKIAANWNAAHQGWPTSALLEAEYNEEPTHLNPNQPWARGTVAPKD